MLCYDDMCIGCRGLLLELVAPPQRAQLPRRNSRGQMVISRKSLEHSSGFLMKYGNSEETEWFTTPTVELC